MLRALAAALCAAASDAGFLDAEVAALSNRVAKGLQRHWEQPRARRPRFRITGEMLAGIPLDSGIRVLEDNYKVEKYIKIAQLFLEARRGL